MNPLVEYAQKNEEPSKEVIKRANDLFSQTILALSAILTFILYLTI